MIDSKRFSLNRIACPSLSMAEFLDLARGVGISKVELRNDIRDGRVLDGMDPKAVAKLMAEKGVRAITVNALQKFNLASARPKARADLASLLADCAGVGCPALVLCPNNESNDARSAGAKFAEAVDSLKEFGPMFEKAGVLGLVEPLGFGISSLASVAVAIEAVEKSGFPYKVLVDTFHHYLGPDDASTLKKAARAGLVGLVHVSGVEAAIPKTAFLDAHRIMPGPGDVMNSKAIIQTLLDAGYEGDISFEPFSGEVQAMSPKALSAALARSMEYLAR